MIHNILSAISSNLSPETQWRAKVFASTISSLRRRAQTGARDCNFCGYHGFFDPFGRPVRPEALSRKYGLLVRHRLFFVLDKVAATGPLSVKHSLHRGDKLFLASKAQ
jgi:hypothetical protein